jgi:hypothetical protein
MVLMNATFRVEIVISKSMDVRDDPQVQLRVQDNASGETLAYVDITSGQWLALQTGTSLKFGGITSNHLERVGKEMHVRRIDIPRETFTSYKRDEQKQQARSVALKYELAGETTEVRSTNSGWVAIYRSWS